jgi:hypothetical protein
LRFSILVEPGLPFLFLPLTMMMAPCPEAFRFFALPAIFDPPVALSSAGRLVVVTVSPHPRRGESGKMLERSRDVGGHI